MKGFEVDEYYSEVLDRIERHGFRSIMGSHGQCAILIRMAMTAHCYNVIEADNEGDPEDENVWGPKLDFWEAVDELVASGSSESDLKMKYVALCKTAMCVDVCWDGWRVHTVQDKVASQ